MTTRASGVGTASSAASGTEELAAKPTVGVVIATHNRPQLMRRALQAVLDQKYEGSIEVVLVFDRCAQDIAADDSDPRRVVRVLNNSRTPGLAGARNTGILALETDLVAFCDDDDEWLPSKLDRQVDRLRESPGAQFVTTAMVVTYDGHKSIRRAGKDVVTLADLTRSRMAMLHSSSFVFWRKSMVDGFGLVDESIPQSMAEDWDLLLRAAREHAIEHIDEPLVRIKWGATSYFNEAWRAKNEASEWLLRHHPEMRGDDRAAALQHGKLAFGYATLRQRRTALRHVHQCLRRDLRQPRAYLAAAVVLGLPGAWVQQTLNRRGHGV